MARDVGLNVKVGMKDTTGKQLKGLESSVIRTVGAISAAFAGIQAILFPVRNAIRFERAMADVAKTTGYADEDIKRLSESLGDMSKELGTAADDLAEVAAIAGQLGLGDQGRKAVEAFTESVARASVTLGLSVDKTAEGGAQLSAIFGKSVEDVERVFSTINELSNNSVAAGGDLIDIMKRVGTTSGATFEQVAGLAATVRQLGVPNEQAGTGLVKYLGNLLAESKKFSQAMGIAQSEWVDKVKTDSVEALKYVLRELSNLGAAEQAELIKKLFGSGRLFALGDKLVGDAANNFQVLNKMLNLSTKGYEEGTSSIEEYNRIMDTTAKQLDVLKESFVALGIKAGNKVLPVLQKGIESLSATLQDEEVVAYFVRLGEGLAGMVEGISEGVRWVSKLEIEWTNVIQAIKVFLGFKIAAAIIGWAYGLKSVVGWFTKLIAKVNASVIAIQALSASFGKVQAQAATSKAVTLFTPGTAGNITKIGAAATIATASVGILGKSLALLGKAVRAIFGPIGLITTIGILTFEKWGAQVLDFLGFVDRETAKSEREAAAKARDAAKLRRETIADAEEFSRQVKKIVNVPYKGVEYSVTLDAEDAKKELGSLAKAFVSLNEGIEVSELGLETQRETMLDLTKEHSVYTARLEALKKKLESLYKSKALAEQQGAVYDTTLIDKTVKEVEQVKASLSTTEIAIKRTAKALERYRDSVSTATSALSDTVSPEIAKRFDTQTAAYARVIAGYKKGKEELKELQDELDSLEKQSRESEGLTVEEDTRYREIQNSITDLRLETDEWEKSMISLRGTLSLNQTQLADFIDTMDADTVRSFSDDLNDLFLGTGDQTAKYLRENANDILYNHLQLTKLQETYGKVSKAATAYAKTAKSVFNNTGNEIIALSKKLAQFAVDFKTSLVDRRVALKLDVTLDGLDEEYEKAKKAIEDKYDDLENSAEKSSGRWSVFQVRGSKEAELAELELQHTRNKANAQAKAAQEQFNTALQRTKKLMDQANEAAKEGDINKALALKESAKRGIDEANELLENMRSIRTKDIFGKDSFKFSDSQLDSMLDRMLDAGKELGGGIEDVNSKMNETASAAADKWSETLNTISSEFAKSEATVNAMKSTFSNFAEMMAQAQESFKLTASEVNTSLDNLSDQTDRDPQSVSVDVDPAEFNKNIAELTEKAKEGFNKAIGEGIKNGLQDASGYYDTRELNIPIGVNAEINEQLIQERLNGVEVELRPTVKPLDPDEAVLEELNAEFSSIEIAPNMDTTKAKEDLESMEAILTKIKLLVDKDNIKVVGGGSGGGTAGFARGGPVSGPGTSTSDSIPAWLSTGEFVIDAFTTKFFGSSFFSGLQNLARGGRSSRSMKRGLPAFASGGLVESFTNGSAATANRDVVDVNLNIGDNSFRVQSERDQVKGLVNAFKYLQNGPT